MVISNRKNSREQQAENSSSRDSSRPVSGKMRAVKIEKAARRRLF